MRRERIGVLPTQNILYLLTYHNLLLPLQQINPSIEDPCLLTKNVLTMLTGVAYSVIGGLIVLIVEYAFKAAFRYFKR